MVDKDERNLTVLVLGEPGRPTRRFRVNRSAIVLLALALPCAAVGVGYVLGNRHAAESSVATIASATRGAEARVEPQPTPVEPAAAAAVAADPEPARVAEAEAAPTLAPQAPAEAPAAAAAAPIAPAADAPPSGAPFQISRDGQSQVHGLHLFAADGSPRAEAFQQLETLMACGSGQSQAPDVALVRVMFEAQQNFGKPVVLLAGRCSGHGDHPDTATYHRSGRAADFRVRGVTSEQLMNWLIKRGVPGVGRYQRGGYVHIDVRTGPHEQWETAAPPSAEKPAVSKDVASEAAAPAVAPSEAEPEPPSEPSADPAAAP